jgi:hypothetical protein
LWKAGISHDEKNWPGFHVGHETSKPVGEGSRRTVFGVGIGAFAPLVAMIIALLIGRYFFG